MGANDRSLFNEGGILKLRDNGEWRPLLITEATGSRTVRLTDGTKVLESFSVSGDENTVNINSGSANLGGGSANTSNNAACFTFPLLKRDGTSYRLDEQFSVDLFMEWTDTPGTTDNNTCFMTVCLTDGTTEWAASGEEGLMGPMVIWNHGAGHRIGIISRGGGQNNATQDPDVAYFRSAITTTNVGTNYPVYRCWVDGYNSSGGIEKTKVNAGSALWGGSMASRPTVNAALSVGFGRKSQKTAHSEFTVRIYYRVSPVFTYEGTSTLRPGT